MLKSIFQFHFSSFFLFFFPLKVGEVRVGGLVSKVEKKKKRERERERERRRESSFARSSRL